LVYKRITALVAVPALVTFGLAAATSASASTRPASVSAAHHTVRTAAANAVISADGEQHARDALTLEPSDLGLAHPGLPDQPTLVNYVGFCLTIGTTVPPIYCLTYGAEDTQATITDVPGDARGFDQYSIRTVGGTNTFTDGSGYNSLYSGDVVYCFEDSNGGFLHAGQEADGDVIVEGWTAGVCTGVWDEWVQDPLDGPWWINVGETDWYYAQGETQYPYSSVMTTGCDNDTTCHVWVEESTPKGNNDNQWYLS
jgi:hypothetical protein